MKRLGPELRRMVMLPTLRACFLAVFFAKQAIGEWFNNEHILHASDSVRVKAEPVAETTKFGQGSTSEPVVLRSISYGHINGENTQRPYEWFLKFDTKNFVGMTVDSAILEVSKCEATLAGCYMPCVVAGTCSCGGNPPTAAWTPTQGLACGGGNIGETYSAGSDDLNVWRIPSDWESQYYTFEKWKQTWNRSTAAGVEQCCDQGEGNSGKFTYAYYVNRVTQVGKTSTASIDVTAAFGTPVSSTSPDQIYSVTDNSVSLRLTVNGTNSRFFVPTTGALGYRPKLTLRTTYTTTTNTTTTTSTSSTSTTSNTTTTTTTSTSTTTTSTTTTSTITTTTTNSTSITSTTTTSTIITTTTNSTSITSTTSTSTTSTTTSTTAGATTSTSTTAPTTSSTSSTSALVTTTTSTTSTTNATAVALAVHLDQLFWMQLETNSGSVSDIVKTEAFRHCIRDAVAQVQGISAGSVSVANAGMVQDGRRLQGLPVHGIGAGSVSLANAGVVQDGRRLQGQKTAMVGTQSTFPVGTTSQQLAMIQMIQDPQFHDAFAQHLATSADARLQGLKILAVFHKSITASSQDGLIKLTALGGLFSVYGALDPSWDKAKLTAWGANAAAAVQAALISSLSHIVPASDQTTFANITEASLGTSEMKVEFFLFASVPRSDGMSDSVYDARVESFRTVINTIQDSAPYWQKFQSEMQSSSVPNLPSMSNTVPGPPPTIDDTKGAGMSPVLTVILVLMFVLLLTCLCVVGVLKDPVRRARYAPCCLFGDGTVTRAFSGDIESRDTESRDKVDDYHEGYDEFGKHQGPRGSALADDDDFMGNGNIGFLDLIHHANLGKDIATPKKDKKNRSNDTPLKNRMTTHKLGTTDDKETDELRFAMGSFKPWKTPEKPGYRGSPASTRATTNSSRDENSPNSSRSSPSTRPIGRSGMDDTPDKSRISPHGLEVDQEKDDDQVTIETVCSESETSSEDDDSDDGKRR